MISEGEVEKRKIREIIGEFFKENDSQQSRVSYSDFNKFTTGPSGRNLHSKLNNRKQADSSYDSEIESCYWTLIGYVYSAVPFWMIRRVFIRWINLTLKWDEYIQPATHVHLKTLEDIQ